MITMINSGEITKKKKKMTSERNQRQAETGGDEISERRWNTRADPHLLGFSPRHFPIDTEHWGIELRWKATVSLG